jgi:hypothetical protein
MYFPPEIRLLSWAAVSFLPGDIAGRGYTGFGEAPNHLDFSTNQHSVLKCQKAPQESSNYENYDGNLLASYNVVRNCGVHCV